MAARKKAKQKAKKKAAKKSSLVENINRRKRAGASRPRSRSTISSAAYRDMQAGWPRAAKKSKGKKKLGKRTTRRTKR